MKRRAAADHDLSPRLDYVAALRIVPSSRGLRAGHVRDVARGEVFIHASWTADPWHTLTACDLRMESGYESRGSSRQPWVTA